MMSSFKNILKSDTPTSGRRLSTGLGGQGSHFPKDDDTPTSIATGPTTVTGTQDQAVGSGDASAVPSLASKAAAASGPETGGQEHVGTAPATSATQSTADQSTMASSAQGNLTQAERQAEGGTAAIGETTTYSSQPLATGDPVGSVVDHESTDPLTYKLPEHSRATESASVQSPATATSSAAAAAASAAWASHNSEKMPGEYPSAGYENPYRATHALDPRVDGGKVDDPVDTSSSSAAPAAATVVSSTSEKPTTDTSATGPPPSTLTTAVDPAERSAEYSGAVADKGLDSTATPATGTAQAESGQEQQGITGKVLGSLGIGSAAAAAAGYLGYGKKSEAADEPHDTSAIATQPDQKSQETGPPKHYRRESIPTTAYPAGVQSPAAIAPPVGGTQPTVSSGETRESGVTATEPTQTVHDQTTTGSESHTSRYTITGGAAAAGAGAGAGAYALHEHKEEEAKPTAAAVSDTTAPVSDATATTSQPAAGATSTVPDRTREAPIDAVAAAPGRLEDQDAKPSASSALAQEPEKTEEDHTGRNAALGAGAGAAVAGGAAYAAHEKSERDAAQEAAQHEKELAKQREAQQKEAAKAEKEHQKEIEKQEKQHQKEVEKEQKKAEKEAEKEQKKAEKEEAKHQKEVEKEEKKQQKELEKEEKEKQAALAAAEEREKARIAAEDEDRMRKEREAAAGVGTAAVTGAGVTAYEKEHEAEGEEKKKKPSIFKRIFKRRKNKDTGEDEDYSTDDEEDKAAKEGRVPIHHSEDKDRNVLGAGAATGAGAAAAGSADTENRESITGLPYDPEKDPAAAARLSKDASAAHDTHGRGIDSAPAGAAVDNPPPAPLAPEDYPIEPRTGMPYNPQLDEAAAARLEAAAKAREDGGVTEDPKPDPMTEPFGVIGDHKR